MSRTPEAGGRDGGEGVEVRGWSLGVHVACSLGIQIVEAFCVVCESAHQFIPTGVPE